MKDEEKKTRKKRKKKNHRVSNLVLVLILLTGAVIMAYPSFSEYWNSLHQSRAIMGYAQRVAETTVNRPIGVYAMKRKLKAKGVSDEDAEAALGAFDDAQQLNAAKAAAEKLARKYLSLPIREGKSKLSQALARRGFAWDVVREAVESVFSDEDWKD